MITQHSEVGGFRLLGGTTRGMPWTVLVPLEGEGSPVVRVGEPGMTAGDYPDPLPGLFEYLGYPTRAEILAEVETDDNDNNTEGGTD